MSEIGSIEKLRRDHVLDSFDCGKEDLNRFLKRQAWNSQQSQSAQIYVLAKVLRVVGYYSLTAGSVTHEEATERDGGYLPPELFRRPKSLSICARIRWRTSSETSV